MGNDFPARIAEVAFAIKFTDVPGLLFANPIDRADKIAIRHRMRGLLQLPEILRQSRYRRRRVEHDLRPVQAQNACPFGKMPVVTDVNANPGILRFKDRITQIARGKVELFPEARMAVRDVVLSVFSKIAAIGVDHRRSVEIQSRHLLFINRNYDHHAMFGRDFLHQLSCGTIRHALGKLIPTRVLFRAKVRTIKEFLQTQDLCPLFRRLINQLQMLVDHRLFDLRQRVLGAEFVFGLDQAAADNPGHDDLRKSEL